MASQYDASLYIHVPFCTKKCHYCHFFVLPHKQNLVESYLTGLSHELTRALTRLADTTLVSLYFGGGTPSLLPVDAIARIIDQISPLLAHDAEITIEANPESTTLTTMRALRDAGINRVSIGVQSLQDDLLTTLTRDHKADVARRAVSDTADAGIGNISIDLMYDVPGQTPAHWQETLQCATELPITHLSLYNLTFEPGTVFHKKKETLIRMLPDEEASATMYNNAVETLARGHLMQYEISAFAKAGYQSRHNVGYWTGRPFLGLGPSAFSDWEGTRFQNHCHLGKWLDDVEAGRDPIGFSETLQKEAKMREMLAVGLRLLAGVDIPTFQARFGSIDAVMDDLDILVKDGLIVKTDRRLMLTDRGRLFYDTIATALI